MTSYARDWAELSKLLIARVERDPAPVMGYDLIVVPSAGHQRALSQQLATSIAGPQIAAGLQFVQLPRLSGHLARLLIDAGQLTEDGWRGVALQLGLIELLADQALSDQLAPLLRYLGAPGERPGRAFTTAGRIASIFRRYASQAPEMIAHWRAGRDLDPTGAPLGERDQWQPHAWRGLLNLLGPDPAHRHEQLLDLLRAAAVPGLPARVLVALLDDPTPSQAELIAALATHHEMHQFALAGTPGDARPASSTKPESTDHRLLRVPGRTRWLRRPRSTEHHSAFAGHSLPSHPSGAARDDEHRSIRAKPAEPSPGPADSAAPLLRQVQHELRHGLAPAARQLPDSSFQIHASHGPGRQVEVLRDVLCGLFSDDPTLQPRDVVVLCPALAEYAPLISASFGLDSATNPGLHPGHQLRAQLAAPAISALNPVLAVLARVFELHEGRATSVELFDLCQLPPVAERFAINSDDLEAVHRLLQRSQVRWGLDAAHRKRNEVPNAVSTWLAGIQRMLVSLAFDAEPFVDMKTITPVEQIEGADAALIGRLAELVSRVRKVGNDFNSPASAAVWADRLRAALDLLVAVSPDDQWQLSHAHAVLADFAEQAAGRGAELQAGDIAVWLNAQQQASGRRPNYGNGSMIFTSLEDLAGIEARVICVLGLDDNSFPGAPIIDGDDLLDRPAAAPLRHWTTDRRARRRQRLRDALLAAGDSFVVITKGADEATGAELPIPLCIAELVDLCAISGASGSWRDPGANALVKWHPLHAHGWADFTTEAGQQPVSFDEQALRGARQLNLPRGQARPLWQVQLPVVATEAVLDLDDLVNFYANPAKSHFRRATATSLGSFENPLATVLPIELDGLAYWQAGHQLYSQLLAGVPVEQARRQIEYDGQVLTDSRGSLLLDQLVSAAAERADEVRAAQGGRPERFIDCDVELPGCRLQSRIALFGDRLVLHRFGDVKDWQVLSAWLQLLLLSAHGAQDPAGLDAVVVGKYARRLTAPDQPTALRLLGELVRVRHSGLATLLPLPLECATSFAGWRGTRAEPLAAARNSFGYADDHWTYYFTDFDALAAVEPLPDDPVVAGGPWTSRFELLASWLLEPITEHRSSWSAKQEVGQ